MSNQMPVLIAVLLDKSGSMHSLKGDIIGSFNQFLEEQQREVGEATFMLNAFNDRCETVISPTSLRDIKPLTDTIYITGGNTALLDAIVATITDIETYLAKNGSHRVFVIILTDGMENASKEMTAKEQVGRMLEELQGKGWQFRFLSADWDAVQEAHDLNVHHSVHFHRDDLNNTMSGTSQDLSSFRRGGGSDPNSSGGGGVVH